MIFEETKIQDCYLINSFNQEDKRGGFVKTYHSQEFIEKGIDFRIREIYYTWSEKNVFRGFHFQLPPHDHTKIVFCNYGEVIDYVVDLRKDSEVYGKVFSFQLNDKNRKAILIPKGCAHGFYVPNKKSMLTYLVETEHASDYDSGILWTSFEELDFDAPVISERDSSFLELNKFETPFKL